MTLTYSSYLKIDELLSLQEPQSDPEQHDELLFIVIHQAYELWFKELLHELDHLDSLLRRNDTPGAQHTLGRVARICRVAVAQMDIMETMTPTQFLSFRDRLETASGFQSAQFRELELALGQKRADVLSSFTPGSDEHDRLERRLAEPCLWDGFLRYLQLRGRKVPMSALDRDVTKEVKPSPTLQELLVEIYRDDPSVSLVCEGMIELDELIQEWRYRHVKMVERMLGNKPGTGGSAGVAYLKSTLFRPFFPDLWQLRSALERP
ncbi:MAG: tryptophan 2,3-dioxygenase [Deltaproteobacteria bacterium]|nr:tryptophan 2,3-dioxygenase [Deltaproteobacteria bacterium]